MKSGNNLYWILAILSMACYAWIGWQLFHPAHAENTFQVCLFKTATGIPCPSCGTTRSLLLLFSGNVIGCLMLNPMGVLAALLLLTIPLWIITDVLTGKKTLAPIFLWTERKIKSKKAIYLPLAALALLNWGWNILKDL